MLLAMSSWLTSGQNNNRNVETVVMQYFDNPEGVCNLRESVSLWWMLKEYSFDKNMLASGMIQCSRGIETERTIALEYVGAQA